MSKTSSIPYLLIGVGIGGALGLLLAPRSGAETQEWISGRVTEGLDDLNKKSGRLRDAAGAWKRRAQDKATEMTSMAQETLQAVQDDLAG